MTKNELRYQGTELQLMDAFSQAIRQRPLDRITVTGLVAQAGISKAAFYRHYRDIQDLAETFAADYALDQVESMADLSAGLRDPYTFAISFAADLRADGVGTALVGNGLARPYLDELADDFIERLTAEGLLPQIAGSEGAGVPAGNEDAESAAEDAALRFRMAVRFAFQGMAALALRYPDYPDEYAQVAAAFLRAVPPWRPDVNRA